MKEMVYTELFHEHELLDYGWHKGRRYWVTSTGRHPCCYVEILKRDLWYRKSYDDINLDVHGGPTYADEELPFDEYEGHNWFLGWDYGHCGDYSVMLGNMAEERDMPLYKWTTEELHDACINALDQVHACGNVWK